MKRIVRELPCNNLTNNMITIPVLYCTRINGLCFSFKIMFYTSCHHIFIHELFLLGGGAGGEEGVSIQLCLATLYILAVAGKNHPVHVKAILC